MTAGKTVLEESMKRTKAFGECLLACSLLLGASASAYAQVSGAIFTTLSDGSRVNANIYSAKCGVTGVWLDGGPGPNAPQGAAGLPDGDYYFQVTDPSGKTLLSTDAVMFRQFHVSAGIISGLSGSGNHNTSIDLDHGAVTIELCPFNNTTNPGGVYKVWATPIAQFQGDPTQVDSPNASCKNGCFHGFIPAFSKTDNFKVGSGPGAACLTVWKDTFHPLAGDDHRPTRCHEYVLHAIRISEGRLHVRTARSRSLLVHRGPHGRVGQFHPDL
jgi:hypothetical protein